MSGRVRGPDLTRRKNKVPSGLADCAQGGLTSRPSSRSSKSSSASSYKEDEPGAAADKTATSSSRTASHGGWACVASTSPYSARQIRYKERVPGHLRDPPVPLRSRARTAQTSPPPLHHRRLPPEPRRPGPGGGKRRSRRATRDVAGTDRGRLRAPRGRRRAGRGWTRMGSGAESGRCRRWGSGHDGARAASGGEGKRSQPDARIL